MPSCKVEEIIPASAQRVFDLVHDYERRLEWDTLLRAAYIEPPFKAADKDVVTVCKGRWMMGEIVDHRHPRDRTAHLHPPLY